MVLKANDRCTSSPLHDKFHGPRSDYVRQVALAATQQQLSDQTGCGTYTNTPQEKLSLKTPIRISAQLSKKKQPLMRDLGLFYVRR
ncbi:hypothetical protein TNCV_3193261 [Trichonephila clavipes]|nr:hypothetical protein TNCV_3193261 [Trichonephila clavipes]